MKSRVPDPASPLGLPRRPSTRPPPLDRSENEGPTLDEFATGGMDLRTAFPLVYDSTTMQGFAALRRWMPEDWPEAMSQGRASHPPLTRDSRLTQLLERGSRRVFPVDPGDIDQVQNRRSALAHLHDTLPSVRLGAITERGLEALVETYRHDRGDLSCAMISAHITELRAVIREAREEAGLRPLRPAPAATGRQGRRVCRPMATLEEVGRILRCGPPDVQILVALILATAALPQHVLQLARGAVDLDAGRVRIDTFVTRRPDTPEGHMVHGLPRWCIDLLRHHHPDIDTWPDDRPLFPRRPNSQLARRTASAIFRTAADKAGCFKTRLQDIRRLSQGIHAHAPRAVRRGTATARRDVAYSLGSSEARKVADAQEAYAAQVVRQWRYLNSPPVEPRCPPRRATAAVRAHEPERPWPTRESRTRSGLPVSCIAIAPRAAAASAPSSPAPDAFVADIQQHVGTAVPVDATAILLQAQTFGRLTRRAEMAERELARISEQSLPKDEAYSMALLVAVSSFAAGMSVEHYLLSKPALQAELGEKVGRYAVALGEAVMEQMRGSSP